MREQYEFEPAAVELEFGVRLNSPDPSQEENALGLADLLPSREELGVGSPVLPAWEMDLGKGHKLVLQGRIDRVDLWRAPQGMTSAGLRGDSERSVPRGGPDADSALCVVMDYKSSPKQLDPVLMQHEVQLQLLGYLSVLRHWPDPRPLFGVARLIPAGVFYVNLRGKYERGSSRAEVLAGAEEARKLAYRHTGRFDASCARSSASAELARKPPSLFRRSAGACAVRDPAGKDGEAIAGDGRKDFCRRHRR